MFTIMKKTYITPQLITVTVSASTMIVSSLTGTNLEGQRYGGDVSDENQQPEAAVKAYSVWDDFWE